MRLKVHLYWEFPGCPVMRTLRFTVRVTGWISGWGTKILQAMWPKKKCAGLFCFIGLAKNCLWFLSKNKTWFFVFIENFIEHCHHFVPLPSIFFQATS